MSALPRESQRSAFSLVELLVVLTVISLLTVMSGTGLQSITGTGLRQGVYDIAALLELARNEAVARQTYVWVGFENGVGEVKAAAAYSVNGSGTDTSPVSWTKVIYLKNANLIGWSDLKQKTRDYSSQLFNTSITPDSVARNGGGAGAPGQTFKTATTQFNGNTITFTPRGQAILKGSVDADEGYNPYIDISFHETRGNVVPANADDASIIVDGATGAVQIVQLQVK